MTPIPCTERCQMQKTIHKMRDKNHARRLIPMLMLRQGDSASHVASTLSSIGRFNAGCMDARESLPLGRKNALVSYYII